MTVKAKTIKGDAIKKSYGILNKIDYEINRREVNFVRTSAKKHLGKTLQFRDQSGTKAFSGAGIVVIEDLDKNSPAPRVVKYQVVVKDTKNKPHLIWHVISNGRAGNKTRMKKAVKFRLRKDVRTTRNTLKVSPFGGWSDNYGFLQKGQYLPEIKGRRWYEKWLYSYLRPHHRKTKYFSENITVSKDYEVKKG